VLALVAAQCGGQPAAAPEQAGKEVTVVIGYTTSQTGKYKIFLSYQ